MRKINYKNPVSEYPSGEHMQRNEHVRIRLVPVHQGNPIQIKFTSAEKTALIAAADQLGYFPAAMKRGPGLSAFLRDIGKIAAVDHAALDLADQINAAATASGMGAGEWLRCVALSAVGFTPLAKQLVEAREAYKSGKVTPDFGYDEGEE